MRASNESGQSPALSRPPSRVPHSAQDGMVFSMGRHTLGTHFAGRPSSLLHHSRSLQQFTVCHVFPLAFRAASFARYQSEQKRPTLPQYETETSTTDRGASFPSPCADGPGACVVEVFLANPSCGLPLRSRAGFSVGGGVGSQIGLRPYRHRNKHSEAGRSGPLIRASCDNIEACRQRRQVVVRLGPSIRQRHQIINCAHQRPSFPNP
jgi:hypothetical protein